MASYVDPIEFYDSIDLTKNDLMNAAVHPLAAPPASPVQGQVYFDTVKKQLGQFDGAVWIYYGSGGAGVYKGTSATFSALPTGVNNDWALLTATDGSNPRGIYSLVAGVWTLQQNLASVSIVGLYKGHAATFAALPTSGVSDGDWCLLTAKDGTNERGIYDRVTGAWVLRQSLAATSGGVTAWAASTAVNAGELRSMTMTDSTVVYMMSNSARTTGISLNVTELGEWTYLGQSIVGAFPPSQSVIKGYQISESGAFYQSDTTRLTPATFDTAEQTVWGGTTNPPIGLYKGTSGTFAGLPATTVAQNGDWALLVNDDIGMGTALNPDHVRGIYSLVAGVWTIHQSLKTTTSGVYKGSAATFATLPTGAITGDWSLLTADTVGTGTALNPQYPLGIYAYDGTNWVLSQKLSVGAGITFTPVADSSTLTAKTYSTAEPANAVVQHFTAPAVTANSWFAIANTGLGVMDVDISGVHTQITANGGALWTANAAGTAWVMIDALQPTVQKEIGIGSTLPANNATCSFFNLIGNASLPDGIFFWDNAITTWVQA